MARLTTNIKRVKRSVTDTQARYSLRSRSLARKMGRAARENVRANIAPRAAGGVFPGYAMSGQLRRRAVASEPKKQGKSWIVRVRIRASGLAARIASIHELGGVILAKRGPYLHFNVQGQWVRTPAVTIRRKLYFAKGIEKTRREYNVSRLRKEF